MSTARQLAQGTVAVGTPYVNLDVNGNTFAVAVQPAAGGTVLVEVCWGSHMGTPDWRPATNQAAAAMSAIAAGAGATSLVSIQTAPAPMGVRITATTAACDYQITGLPCYA